MDGTMVQTDSGYVVFGCFRLYAHKDADICTFVQKLMAKISGSLQRVRFIL